MKIRIYKDKKREWRWSLADRANGKIMADSSEGYKNRKDCVAALEKVTNAQLLQLVKNDLQLLINTLNRIQEGHRL